MTDSTLGGYVVTLAAGVRLVTIECGQCGIVFAMTEKHVDALRESHATFYCPNGNARAYNRESKAEKFERLYHSAEARAGHNYDRAERSERSLSATRGVVTRLRNRAHAGTCPFGCRRHFENLERHVASKHPGEKLPAEEG